MVLSILFYILIVFVCAGIVVAKYKKIALPMEKLTKILAIILYVAILVKGFAADAFVGVIHGGILYHFEYYVNRMDLHESLIRWGFLATECLIVSLLISKNKRVKWILSYVSLPLVVFGILYFPWSIQYFLKPIEFGFYLVNPIFAGILTLVEYVLVFSICFSIHLLDSDKRIESKMEAKQTIKIGIFTLFVCIPFLVYASIFGTTNIELDSFNYVHIGWIIITILLAIGIVFLFKREEEQTRFTAVAVMVFFLVWHFISCFKVGYASNRFPLQLCNFAPFLFLFILLTRNQKVFNFVFVANPVGAIIAMIATDTGNIFNYWMIHYIVEHTYVMIIPIMFICLGYMKLSKFKEIVRDYFIIFTCYFFVCLFTDCIHNGIIWRKYGNDYINDVNFFFLIKCPIDVSFYPSLLFGKMNLFGQEVYFGYLLFIFVVFTLLGFIFYFIPIGIRKLKSIIVNQRRKIENA